MKKYINIVGGVENFYYLCDPFEENSKIIKKQMAEIVDTERVYSSPAVLIIGFKSEGVLCISNNIPDWEENDDIL